MSGVSTSSYGTNQTGREVEIKYQLLGDPGGIIPLRMHLENLGIFSEYLRFEYTDFYWCTPAEGTADFLRLRYHKSGVTQLCSKTASPTGNYDREELEAELAPTEGQRLLRLLNSVHGTPHRFVNKISHVYTTTDGYAVCIYYVRGIPYVEVEGPNPHKYFYDVVVPYLESEGVGYTQETRSVFQILSAGEENTYSILLPYSSGVTAEDVRGNSVHECTGEAVTYMREEPKYPKQEETSI